MKYLMIILLAMLLTGCAGKRSTFYVDVTETGLQETSAQTMPQETVRSPELPERELLTALVNPRDEDFVRIRDYIPDVQVELKYAAADNFTGQTVYDFEDVFLRYGTVMKLKAVAEELAGQGMGIKIWDGFRPVSAQFRLWEICPDDTYVANPNKGYSNHSRGFAVDLTLVDSQGAEVEMPTEFDDFSGKADRDYSDCTETARNNAQLLESIMEKHGFQGYWGEWWHFNDTYKYDVETCFDPGVICSRETAAEAVLLDVFWDESSEILKIPAGEQVTLLGYDEGFVLAEYWGYRGYMPMDCLK